MQSLNKKATKFPRLVIAGLRGGSGKTVLTVGVIRALMKNGLSVTPYKKGPDYIDAGWLSRAAGAPCYNLDPFLIGQGRVLDSFTGHFRGDCAVIEGNRGVFDGMDSEGSLSTASLAKTLRAPVVVVIDCTKTTRTAAALILGVRKFDRHMNLSGVVLNRLAGARHEKIIRESIQKYTDMAVLGAIPKLGGLSLPERHMGLTPHQEHKEVEKAVSSIEGEINKYLDIKGIIEVMKSAPPLKARKPPPINAAESVKIGIIRDSAFQFYYRENLDALECLGAELIEINSLTADCLPDLDALYIGGGFPETHAVEISRNRNFLKSLKSAVKRGLPVYAECGGLMFLGESLRLEGKKYKMAGVFPIGFTLHKKPQAHGYTIAKVISENPFYKKGTVLRGHEFHYSRPVPFENCAYMSFRMLRGEGISDGMDGIIYGNVLATYTHVHATGTPEWAEGMIKAAKAFGKGR